MKNASRVQRASAAIAAVTISLSIVWMLSSYAYPEAASSWFGQMAKRAAFQYRS